MISLLALQSINHVLFLPRWIPIQDGDNAPAKYKSPHADRLVKLLIGGTRVMPIQVIHYATPHYISRHGTLAGRFGNAVCEIGPSLQAVLPYSSSLRFTRNENHELMQHASEVLAVGISTWIMCKMVPAKLSEVKRIDETGKRCDFRIVNDQGITVYESRGRESDSKKNEAVEDLADKKKAHPDADYLYGIVSIMPRNASPTHAYIYDPPSEGHREIRTEDRIIQMASHYEKVLRLLGETRLAAMVQGRIRLWRQSQDFSRKPLTDWYSREGGTLNVQGRRYTSIQKRLGRGTSFEFGLSEDVLKMVAGWRVEELLQFQGETYASEEEGLSLANDGTVLRLRYQEGGASQ